MYPVAVIGVEFGFELSVPVAHIVVAPQYRAVEFLAFFKQPGVAGVDP